MSQKESWTELTGPGDRVLEERKHADGTVTNRLCLISPRSQEQNLDDIPQDLVDVLVKGGAIPVKTTGWEG